MNPLAYDFRNRDDLSKRIHQSSGDTVFYCARCGCPVVDSLEYRQGHKDRLGHYPESREEQLR